MSAEVSPAELAAELRSGQPPHLLDVREPDEHRLVALPDSKLIPLRDLYLRARELAPWRNERIVVYCHHGQRSLNAASQLRRLGFDQAVSLAGGVERWAVEIDPSLPRY